MVESEPELRERRVDSPGRRLRRGRERMALSVADAAESLHLDTGMIEALEEDDYDRLPPLTFVRGYLRAYARLVDCPEGEILEALESQGPSETARPLAPSAGAGSRTISAGVGGAWVGPVLGIVALFGLMVGGGWLAWQSGLVQRLDLGFVMGVVGEDTESAGGGLPAPRVAEGGGSASEPLTAGTETATAPVSGGPAEPGEGLAEADPPATQDPVSTGVEPGFDESPAGDHQQIPPAEGESWTERTTLPAEETAPDPAGDAPQLEPLVPQPPVEDGLALTGDETAPPPPGALASMDPGAGSGDEPGVSPDEAMGGAGQPVADAGGAGQQVLRFRFQGESWMEVTDARGERLLFGLVSETDLTEVRGVPPFRIVVGDVDHVTLVHEGSEVPLAPHAMGRVARLTVGGE